MTRLRSSVAARNFGWLAVDRGVRMVLSVVVGLWVARYLGPEGFGRLNYALATVALLGPLAELGLEAVLRREFVRRPETSAVLAGTAIWLRFVGGVAAMGIVLALSFLPGVKSDEQRLFLIAALMLFQPSTMVPESWLQSRLESRKTVTTQWIALVGGVSLRILAIYYRSPIEFFALIIVVEQGLSAVLVFRTARASGLGIGKPDKSIAWALLLECWPLALASVSVMIYMRIDIIMLRVIVGESEVGIYSAATRLSEIWYFVPVALASSLLPSLLRSREQGLLVYHGRLQANYDLNVGVAYVLAAFSALTATWLIAFAYGPAFSAAAPVLALHAWTLIFVFMGVSRSQYLVNEGLTYFYLIATGVGMITNVVLNFVLIPRSGALGAALATVFAQAVAAWLSTFMHRRLTDCALMQTRALLLPFRLILQVLRKVPSYPHGEK